MREWFVGAVLALGLHIMCLGVALSRSELENDEALLGAPGIDISIDLTSPTQDNPNMPVGPNSEHSTAAQAAESFQQLKDSEQPRLSVIDSDQSDFTRQDQPSKDESHNAMPALSVTTASVESVASDATALPGTQQKAKDDRSTTRSDGTGNSLVRIKASWAKEVVAHLDRFKRYPVDKSNTAVDIVIAFSIDRFGRVGDVSIARSSGDVSFDDAAISMVRRASPLPAPPPKLADDGLSFSLPVGFRTRRPNEAMKSY